MADVDQPCGKEEDGTRVRCKDSFCSVNPADPAVTTLSGKCMADAKDGWRAKEKEKEKKKDKK
jgi:hypothetical protein